jgi:hypothetical protein
MMKKKLYSLLLSTLAISAAFAQKGNNQFIFGLEAGFPTGNLSSYNTGIGVLGKALMGTGEKSQVGFGTGYTVFKYSETADNLVQKRSVVPFMLIYRQRVSLLYFEPQVGYGAYTSTVKRGTGNTSTKTTTSNGGFTLAVGGGVQLGALDLGLRYQAGFPSGGNMSFLGLHAAYVFRARR